MAVLPGSRLVNSTSPFSGLSSSSHMIAVEYINLLTHTHTRMNTAIRVILCWGVRDTQCSSKSHIVLGCDTQCSSKSHIVLGCDTQCSSKSHIVLGCDTQCSSKSHIVLGCDTQCSSKESYCAGV